MGLLSPGAIGLDALDRFTGIADRDQCRAGSADQIAAGKNPRNAGLVVGIHDKPALGIRGEIMERTGRDRKSVV